MPLIENLALVQRMRQTKPLSQKQSMLNLYRAHDSKKLSDNGSVSINVKAFVQDSTPQQKIQTLASSIEIDSGKRTALYRNQIKNTSILMQNLKSQQHLFKLASAQNSSIKLSRAKMPRQF